MAARIRRRWGGPAKSLVLAERLGDLEVGGEPKILVRHRGGVSHRGIEVRPGSLGHQYPFEVIRSRPPLRLTRSHRGLFRFTNLLHEKEASLQEAGIHFAVELAGVASPRLFVLGSD